MFLGAVLPSCLVLGLGIASALPKEPTMLTDISARHSPEGWNTYPHLLHKNNGTNCKNSPSSRGCWSGKYNISTDSEESWPTTGKTVSYSLTITNQTMSPDGVPRQMLVINGQYPGPTIVADWGDIIQIDVTNKMETNGTSIHWHGINQRNSCTEDGVNGVTECPIPPGATRRYTFQATQHGTTWYHSHFSNQYGDGIVGTMIINGPAAVDYDEDLGVLPINDYYYDSMHTVGLIASGQITLPGSTVPPTADNGLINGTNMNANKTGGAYERVKLTPGKKYRLRLVNIGVDNHFKVSLDSHVFTVIQADFVPIFPYTADWIFLAIGQRYDVVFTASQTPSNYWFRAEVQNGCGFNANNGSISAIFNYNTVPVAQPNSTRTSYAQSCADEHNVVPYVTKSVPQANFTFTAHNNLNVSLEQSPNKVFFWDINGISMAVDWTQPTLRYVADHNTTFQTESSLAVHELPDPNVFAFWVIQNSSPAPHPIHLHGHDFYLLGVSSSGPFTAGNIGELNFENPTRRDVAMLPVNGWMVIAFETNNPGAWLLHCHIAWHVSGGLAVQFLERQSEIAKVMDLSKINDRCKAWDSYFNAKSPPESDSGL